MNREMKNSGIEWIGEIPYSWQIKSVKNEFTRKQSQSSNLENNILTLARSGVKIRDISTGEGQIASDYSKYNYVTPGDLLLNPMDLVSGDNCNISNIYGVISPAYFNLGVKNHANPYFFNYYFKIQYWVGSFFAHGKGVSFENRWTLNYETLRNFPILFPPLNEQQRIVKFLDDKLSYINSLTEQTNQSINELKKYKQSLITEAVTKGIDSTVEMKDSGIEWVRDVPKNWEVKSIKYSVNERKEQLNSQTNPYDEINYVDISSVSYTKGVEKIESLEFKDAPSRARKIVYHNDIIISTVRTYLKSIDRINYNIPLIVSTGFCVLKPKNHISANFLEYAIKSDYFTNQVEQFSTGIAYPSITSRALLSLNFIEPPLNEQQEIFQYLDDKVSTIDRLIEDKTKVVEELENYKKSLIYEYVTGKKEV